MENQIIVILVIRFDMAFKNNCTHYYWFNCLWFRSNYNRKGHSLELMPIWGQFYCHWRSGTLITKPFWNFIPRKEELNWTSILRNLPTKVRTFRKKDRQTNTEKNLYLCSHKFNSSLSINSNEAASIFIQLEAVSKTHKSETTLATGWQCLDRRAASCC